MEKDSVTIELTRDEALVLFEWLTSSDLLQAIPAPSNAERTALWKLEGRLQKILVEPFAPNYADLVADARRRLVAGGKDSH